jgi:hypothetical protein
MLCYRKENGAHLQSALHAIRVVVPVMHDVPPRIIFADEIEQVVRFFLGPFFVWWRTLEDSLGLGVCDYLRGSAYIHLVSRCTPQTGRCISRKGSLHICVSVTRLAFANILPAEGSVEALTQCPSSNPSALTLFLNVRHSLKRGDPV